MMDITNTELLMQRLTDGDIRSIDFAFAEFINDQYPQESFALAELAAYLSSQSGLQHVCVSLNEMQSVLSGCFLNTADLEIFAKESAAIAYLFDDNNRVADTENYPIVFQRGAFYLQRYWVYETRLIRQLSILTKKRTDDDKSLIQPILEELFPSESSAKEELDLQKVAVAVAALNSVTFITGGPGTGKTTTVVKLIALLREVKRKQEKSNMIIRLAAPTGKAAARLTESIASATQYLPRHLSDGMEIRCTTLHRLLGTRHQSIHFEHDSQNPIHADLIIVDEASMIDLPMMSKFFAAVPVGCQVILLGDSEQLASVEVGTVLNDICVLSNKAKPSTSFITSLAKSTRYSVSQLVLSYGRDEDKSNSVYSLNLVNGITRLLKSHRFDANSRIGQLAQAIKMKDVSSAVGLLNSLNSEELRWYQDDEVQCLVDDVLPVLTEYCQKVVSGDLFGAFVLLKKQQVLCSHKTGRWGVENINRRLESELSKRGLLLRETGNYQGRPIMISRNSPAQDLFNGDIGIVAKGSGDKTLLKAWFETSEGKLRGILMNQLPEHETVFAMTVHKSQGSEFDKVILCLPHEKGKLSHLTRSLLYTGLTRTKSKLTVCASLEALKKAITTEVKRGSGLTQRLLSNDSC